MKVYMPEARCPYCSKLMDAATHAGGERQAVPSAGDYTICCDCLEIGRYFRPPGKKQLQIRKLRKNEQAPENVQRDAANARAMLLAFKAWRKARNN